MVSRPSTRKTKTQILAAFDELLAEHKALQTQYEQLRKRSAAKKTLANGSGVSGDVSAYTMDTILGGLVTLRNGFGSATSELSSKLAAEATKLQELRDQIEEKSNRLVGLYSLKIEEETLDQLIQEYIEKSERFGEELKQKRDIFEQEQAEEESAWEKEQEEQARVVQERDEALRKERKRDKEEYAYRLQLERQLTTEQYNEQMKTLYRELDELVQAKEKEWQEREKGISEREKEYKESKAKAESLPAELETAIKKAKKEGEEISRRQTSYTANLLAKEEEGNTLVYEYKIQSLEDTIKRQRTRIESLAEQLEAAVRQAQNLAVKSIEGSAHETSFNALKEIVLEQAKHSSKGK